MRAPRIVAVWVVALAGAAVACGAEGSTLGSGASEDASPSGAPGAGGGSGALLPGGGAAGSPLPPEREIEQRYQAPVASKRFVWVANPTSGRVAFVDAATAEVSLVEAGNSPTTVAALPGADDAAIVLNALSKDATVMRVGAEGIATRRVAVPSGGNAWAVSPSGARAIAWTNAKLLEHADPLDGYQDVTVVDLSQGAEKSVTLSVGYRPTRVAFGADAARAFVVSQDGVSVIDLSGEPRVASNVRLTDPGKSLDADDVVVSPDGARAIARRPGEKGVAVVDLASGALAVVSLASAPTDVELSSDGTTALVVLRETGEVAWVPLPGAIGDPNLVVKKKIADTGQTIGSVVVARTGARAFLYSSAVPEARMSVITPGDPAQAPMHLLLRAPVGGVFSSDDGASALVLHDKPPTPMSGAPATSYVAAFSLALTTTGAPPKVQGLDAKPVAAVISPGGDRALVATGAGTSGPFRAYLARLPSLSIETFELPSAPISAGLVPAAGKAFIAEQHPEGRLSLIDLEGGAIKTITGFELAAKVVYGGAK
ncbi:MAG: hypothetical protein IT374_15575 [Polyangiaceae bacterium]|nr:hypothetical protein [Polyangiaceae bacterium]